MDNRETLDSYFKFLRMVIKYLLFAALAFFVRGFIFLGAGDLDGNGEYSALPFEWMALVGGFLAYFSLTRSFTLYDRDYRDRFFEGEESRLTFARKAKFILSSSKFWIELAITSALALILPHRFGFGALINTLSFYMPVQFSQAKLYVALIAFPLLLLISFWAYLSALNWYILSYRKKKSDEKIGSLFKNLALTVVAYCGGAYMLPVGLSILFTLLNVLTGTAILLVPVVLLVSFVVIWYAKALLKRKKLLQELKKICDDKGFYLSKVKRGYLSIFRLSRESSFTVERSGKTYECKLLCGVRKASPMYLFGNGQGQIIHTFHLRRIELFHFVTSFRYGFESNHKKIVIINPIPKTVYRSGEGRPSEIDVGEVVGDYHIYNATGFLNALERDCLCR